MIRRLAASSVALALAAFVGCSSPSTHSSSATSGSAATQNAFDRNDVLDDASMKEEGKPTVTALQAFLERTPYDQRSVLADYRPKGKPASQVLVDTAKEYGISPMVLVVRAQIETQLVSKPKATDDELDRAFRCGCTGDTCSDELLGFENQARCAAASIAKSLEELQTDKITSKGWAKGHAKRSEDGVVVTPANDATAALYDYLGNVGKLGGGSASVAGTGAFWQLWNAFTGKRAVVKDASADPVDAGGCHVIDGVDSCGSGSRCSRSDGLAGTCVTEECQCGPGKFCEATDAGTRCVECTSSDSTACRAEDKGDRCMPDGMCGCRTSGDCGFDRKRVCGPIRNVCVDDPLGAHDTPTTPDASTTGKPKADASAATEPEDPAPAPAPEMPKASSGSSSKKDKSEGEEESQADLPKGGEESSGCSAAPGAARPGGAFVLALALALAASRRRRTG